MANAVYCRRSGNPPMLNMIVPVLLMIITTVQSQQNTTAAVMTEAPSTAPAAVTTAPATPAMPVEKLVGSVTASEDTGSNRFTQLQNEMTALLENSFSNANSPLAPIYRGIEVENVTFTLNFRLLLANGSDVNGTYAAAVLLGSLSNSGMLGDFMVGNDGVYFWMPTIPEPTEPPFEIPYWGPAVAMVALVVVFIVLVIVAACHVKFKAEKATPMRNIEDFAEL